MKIERDVSLAPLTTLDIGGPARFLARPERSDELGDLLAFAAREGLPTFVLGGGSNVLVSDRGYPGLVLVPANTGCVIVEEGERPLVRVGAGEPWDRLVAWSVAEHLAGLECLSGIPGTVGAAPIQNIGAYGQEAGEYIEAVHVLRLADGAALCLSHDDCEFGYRDSLFKREANGRYVVTAVDFRLTRGGTPRLRYAELNRRFEGASPDLKSARAAVLDIRGGKSMLGSDDDPNRRSAGSFFTNPVVTNAVAQTLVARHEGMPCYPAGGGEEQAVGGLAHRARGLPKRLRSRPGRPVDGPHALHRQPGRRHRRRRAGLRCAHPGRCPRPLRRPAPARAAFRRLRTGRAARSRLTALHSGIRSFSCFGAGPNGPGAAYLRRRTKGG